MRPCVCAAANPEQAKEAIRATKLSDMLVDESHFIVSVKRCAACGQSFLTMFCERVDWADGDDPNVWVAIFVSAEEAQALRMARNSLDDAKIQELLPGTRRLLVHDRPKGGPDVLQWRAGSAWVPAHD